MELLRRLTLSSLDRRRDLGLLSLRLGVAAIFLIHGIPKLTGGPDKWEKVGSSMAELGLDFAPQFWGLLAGLTEAGGAVLLALGLMTRLICIPLIITMLVAINMHIAHGDGFGGSAHAIEASVIFVSLFMMGAGSYSVDAKLAQTDAD